MNALDPRDWLAKRAEVEAAATEGPWGFQPWSKYPLPSGDYAESILLANASPDGEIVRDLPDADGEWIADARTSLPAALDALEAVLELHKPAEEEALTGDCAIGDCEHYDDCPTTRFSVCRECWRVSEETDAYFAERAIDPALYPCPTVAAITAALLKGITHD